MTDKNSLKDRARDELFSHINRCGVLEAADEDQEQWLNETMEYLSERYPDLGESDLAELYRVGLAFCRPAIRHGKESREAEESADVVGAGVEEEGGETVGVGVEDEGAA